MNNNRREAAQPRRPKVKYVPFLNGLVKVLQDTRNTDLIYLDKNYRIVIRGSEDDVMDLLNSCGVTGSKKFVTFLRYLSYFLFECTKEEPGQIAYQHRDIKGEDWTKKLDQVIESVITGQEKAEDEKRQLEEEKQQEEEREEEHAQLKQRLEETEVENECYKIIIRELAPENADVLLKGVKDFKKVSQNSQNQTYRIDSISQTFETTAPNHESRRLQDYSYFLVRSAAAQDQIRGQALANGMNLGLRREQLFFDNLFGSTYSEVADRGQEMVEENPNVADSQSGFHNYFSDFNSNMFYK